MKTIRRKVDVRKLHKSALEAGESGVSLCFLLQDWEDAYNVGGLFRVADACGAEELIMTGRTPYPPHPQIGVTSLGQHRRVAWRFFESHEQAAQQLIDEGWTLVAVEIATEAENYRAYDYPEKTCLVLGNEGKGIYGTVMKKCAASVFIPMAGKGRSLNVHVSAAIIAFEARLRVKD